MATELAAQPRPFVTTDQVAFMIGLTTSAFRTKREYLIEEAGFPEPLAHCLRPMRWKRDEVAAWLQSQGLPRDEPPPPARPSGPNVVLLEEARRA